MDQIITPKKYAGIAAIKRALGKASGPEQIRQNRPAGFTGDDTKHQPFGAVKGNTAGPSQVPSFRQPDLDAENDSELDGQGAPIPGNPSYPRRKVPNSPTRTGF